MLVQRKSSGARGCTVALLLLLAGCATVTPRNAPDARSASAPVRVTEGEFREALAQLVLDVPLTVRPSPPTAHVMPAAGGDGARMDTVMQQALRHDYGRWCQHHEVPGDCLSLLQDGLRLDATDRLTLAVGFSLDTVWEGVTAAVEEQLSSTALKALVAGFVTSYVLMLAAPEPIITKAVAVVLTGYLVAYLGLGPFWSLVQASRELKAATEKATTFAELEEAGHHFGRVLGENGARILILAVTAGLGGRAGMLAKGPLLPGFAGASMQAEALLSLELAALSEARSIALTSSGLVVHLASGAVVATAMGPSRAGVPSRQGSLTGRPTRSQPLDDAATRQAHQRENESARLLAENGHQVEQNPPPRSNGKKPDYKVDGEYFDCYAPSTPNPRSIASGIKRKVDSLQAQRIVLNLDDSGVALEALKQQLQDFPIPGLLEVLVVRNGQLIRFFP